MARWKRKRAETLEARTAAALLKQQEAEAAKALAKALRQERRLHRRKQVVAAAEVDASTGTGAADVSSGWSGGGGSVEVSVDGQTAGSAGGAGLVAGGPGGGAASPVCRVPSSRELVHVDMQGLSPTGAHTIAKGVVRGKRGGTGGRVVAEVLPYDALPERTGATPGLSYGLAAAAGQEAFSGSPGAVLRSSVTALAPVGPRGQSGPARASHTIVEPWHGPVSL